MVAAIIGEAGVGKSRLLRDFLAEAVGADTRVLIGRAYEMEGALPLGPWTDALRGGLGRALPGDSRHSVPSGRPHLRRLLPDLWPEAPPAPAGDGVSRLFEAIAELLRHLASQRLVLVVLGGPALGRRDEPQPALLRGSPDQRLAGDGGCHGPRRGG